MRCRLFIDEVGNGDLKGAQNDDNIRYLSLTGILTYRRTHDKFMQPELDQLKVEFFGHTPQRPVILHRRDIINRKGPFAVLKDPSIRAQFDERLLAFLRDQQYLVITVVIDKREHLSRYTAWHYDPYHYCLHCLVERYVSWLARHNYTGDVVIEPRYKAADKRLKRSFRRLYEEGTAWMSPELAQRVLTSRELKFIPKQENCAGLQIADLIAHPSFRAMRRARDCVAPPDDFGQRIVEILERSKLARHPRNHTIYGYGRKWLPA